MWKKTKNFFRKIFYRKKKKLFINKQLSHYEKSYQFLDLEYARVAYLERGKGEKKILFLHGMTEDALNWFYTMEYLFIKSSHCHLLAMDLPGFGQTTTASYFETSVLNYVNLVKDFLDKKNIDKVTLVGHSMGGQIGALFAHFYSSRVERLILVNSAGFRRFGTLTSGFFKAMPIPGSFLKRVSLMDWFKLLSTLNILENKNYFRKTMYKIALVRKNRLTEYFIERNYNKMMAEGLDRITMIKQSMNAMLDSSAYIDDKLSELSIPICFVWGEDDQLVPVRYGYKGYDLVKGEDKKFFVFRKTGHYPFLERPRDFAEVIYQFTSNG